MIENTTHNKNINIMIGVNANPLNNHVEILRSLVKFRYSNNIKIYLNLSCIDEFEKNRYKKYIDNVIECGNLLFGEKISIVDEKILDENYIKLMGYMGVVVSKIKSGALHESYTYDCLLKAIELRKVLFLYEKSSIYNNLKQKYNVQSIQNELNLTNLVHFKANTGFDEYKIEDLNLWNIMFNALKSEFQKIKFLHIIRPSKELSLPIIKMIHDNFDNQSHRFLVNRRTSLYSCTDFMSIPIVDLFLIGNSRFDRFLYFYRRLNSAEYIIWHGLYIGYGNPILSVKEFIFFALFPYILKKMAWVAWGRDLYDWQYKRKCNIFFKIVNFIGYQLRNNIPYYISIFLPDADEFKKQFGHHRNVFDASYSNSDFIKIAEDAKPNEKYFLRSRPLRIMVGHNANVWGGHIELLNCLAQYRYENIRIYIILSTGIDKNYLIKVKEYAKLLFGKKAICIMRKMPLPKYVNFLWKMDIAVFNLRDQAGLGNLMNLFYMRKKVFLPEDGLLFKFFVSQGLNVSSTNKIKNMDFEEFAYVNKNEKIPKYILDRVNLKKNIKKWQYIFESIDNKKGEIDDGKI